MTLTLPWRLGSAGKPEGVIAAPARLRTRLAAVPDDCLPALEVEGLEVISPHGLAVRLDSVDGLLACSPDLAVVVSDAVATIHPLAAEPGFDVSHSQPRWRDRIFVSFPERDDEVGALRLAESVVHEAMHLHLTNEEAWASFVVKSSSTTYSPWRGTDRAAQGVLPGVFVFSCIRTFLSIVASCGRFGPLGHDYLRIRSEDIRREMSEVDWAALHDTIWDRAAASVARADCTLMNV